MHAVNSGVQEKSIAVLETLTLKQFYNTSEINDSDKPLSMTFKIQDYRSHEAPAFMPERMSLKDN